MGVAKMLAAGVDGVDAFPVEVEVDVSGGLPLVVVVGLPDLAVREARDRVKAAIRNAGLKFPAGRVTVNLAPARRRKDGAAFDLSIALGLAAASGQVPPARLQGVAALGELSLAGRTRPVRGALVAAEALRRAGVRRLIVARASAREAALAGPPLEVVPVDDLAQAIAYVQGQLPIAPVALDPREELAPGRGDLDPGSGLDLGSGVDLGDVRGNFLSKRALVVAAAGGHDLLFVGSPGAGKTMMARCLPGILPPLEVDEALAITRIHGLVGAVPPLGLVRERPFRAPHHTTSYCGLVGGGSTGARPGEVSLAHQGVLFLDELPEFPRRALEALREPLEARKIAVARAWGSVELPADFQLVAAMNPCPCGYRDDPRRACVCSDRDLARYSARISGPLLDRIDLQVGVRPVEPEHLLAADGGAGAGGADGELALDTRTAGAQVRQARERQRARTRRLGARGCLNARLSGRELDEVCELDAGARGLLKQAVGNLTLSARGIVKVKRVARTLADLGGRDSVSAEDVSEALLLRRLDDAPTTATPRVPAAVSPARTTSPPRTPPLAAPA